MRVTLTNTAGGESSASVRALVSPSRPHTQGLSCLKSPTPGDTKDVFFKTDVSFTDARPSCGKAILVPPIPCDRTPKPCGKYPSVARACRGRVSPVTVRATAKRDLFSNMKNSSVGRRFISWNVVHPRLGALPSEWNDGFFISICAEKARSDAAMFRRTKCRFEFPYTSTWNIQS